MRSRWSHVLGLAVLGAMLAAALYGCSERHTRYYTTGPTVLVPGPVDTVYVCPPHHKHKRHN